jgi:hypothetical protein
MKREIAASFVTEHSAKQMISHPELGRMFHWIPACQQMNTKSIQSHIFLKQFFLLRATVLY